MPSTLLLQRPRLRPTRWFSAPRVIFALIMREMTTTYGRSPGGYFWAIFEPAAGIALLSVVFSIAFRAPSLGSSFPLFYATGILVFLMYSEISAQLAQAINFSKALLEYPVVTYLDALLARLILRVMTALLVHGIVFTFILAFLAPPVVLDLSLVAYAYFLTICLSFGVGTMNCVLILAFPIWGMVWGVLNRPLLLVSCVLFTFQTVPQPWRDWLWYNPIVHLIGMMRRGFYPFYEAQYVSPLYVLGLSAALATFGLLLLRRHYKTLLMI